MMLIFWITTLLGMLLSEHKDLFIAVSLIGILVETMISEIIKVIKDTKGD